MAHPYDSEINQLFKRNDEIKSLMKTADEKTRIQLDIEYGNNLLDLRKLTSARVDELYNVQTPFDVLTRH